MSNKPFSLLSGGESARRAVYRCLSRTATPAETKRQAELLGLERSNVYRKMRALGNGAEGGLGLITAAFPFKLTVAGLARIDKNETMEIDLDQSSRR